MPFYQLKSHLTLHADPINPLHAATKRYVDSKASAVDGARFQIGTIPISKLPGFTGEISSVAGTNLLNLTDTTVAAGTLYRVTVDSKGRITSGTTTHHTVGRPISWITVTGEPTTLAGFGITDVVPLSGGTVGSMLLSTAVATDAAHAVTKAKVDDLINNAPVNSARTGDVIRLTVSTPPTGFLRANGGAVSKVDYAALYAIIGDTYTGVTNSLGYMGQPWRQQYVFNLTTHAANLSWSTGTSLLEAISASQAIATKSRAYLLGGQDASGNDIPTVFTAAIDSSGVIGEWKDTAPEATTTIPSTGVSGTVPKKLSYIIVTGKGGTGTTTQVMTNPGQAYIAPTYSYSWGAVSTKQVYYGTTPTIQSYPSWTPTKSTDTETTVTGYNASTNYVTTTNWKAESYVIDSGQPYIAPTYSNVMTNPGQPYIAPTYKTETYVIDPGQAYIAPTYTTETYVVDPGQPYIAPTTSGSWGLSSSSGTTTFYDWETVTSEPSVSPPSYSPTSDGESGGSWTEYSSTGAYNDVYTEYSYTTYSWVGSVTVTNPGQPYIAPTYGTREVMTSPGQPYIAPTYGTREVMTSPGQPYIAPTYTYMMTDPGQEYIAPTYGWEWKAASYGGYYFSIPTIVSYPTGAPTAPGQTTTTVTAFNASTGYATETTWVSIQTTVSAGQPYIAPTYTNNYTTGGTTTFTINGETKTFAGGYGGAATESSFTINIPYTDTPTNFTYSVASGGSLKLTYQDPASAQTSGKYLPAPVSESQAVLTIKRVYLIGGKNSSAVYTAPVNTDGTLGAWTTTTALPVKLSATKALVTTNRVYTLGGLVNSVPSANVYRSNLKSDGTLDTWAQETSLPTPITHSHLILTKNRVYLAGGKVNGVTSETVYTAVINLDGSLGTWTIAESLPAPVHSGQCVVSSSRVYIAGGDSGSSKVYTAPINADGTLGLWVTASALPTALESYQTLVTSSRLYTLGGLTGGSAVATSQYSTFGGGTNDYLTLIDANPPNLSSTFKLPDFTSREADSLYHYVKY